MSRVTVPSAATVTVAVVGGAPAPWGLSGECIVGFVPARDSGPLPAGVERLPGPGLVIAARYESSPVGPYLELAVAVPARAGPRPGMCVTTMVVTTAEARVGGRTNWGFPKELGTLSWSADADARMLRWEERDIVVRGVPGGPPLPTLVPFRTVQRRSDGLVTVGARVRGLARVAAVEVTAAPADPLAALAGRHRGAVISGARLVMSRARLHEREPARERSPRGAAEPALSWPHQGD